MAYSTIKRFIMYNNDKKKLCIIIITPYLIPCGTDKLWKGH